ncbi:MAG: hypothetical protein NC484_02820 [Alloprevotella sp.]|nr:hypothetical protein [Alloprevotella sp.]
MGHYLKLLFQIFLSPRSGWEDVSADKSGPDLLMRRGLLPLAALTSLTRFLTLVYHRGEEFMSVMPGALIEFVAYLAGYFIAILALTAYMPRVTRHGAAATDRDIRLYALCMTGLMALVGLVRNCLPSDFAIVNFLYLYLAVVAWRGREFLHVDLDKEVTFVILAVVSSIIPPLLIMLL